MSSRTFFKLSTSVFYEAMQDSHVADKMTVLSVQNGFRYFIHDKILYIFVNAKREQSIRELVLDFFESKVTIRLRYNEDTPTFKNKPALAQAIHEYIQLGEKLKETSEVQSFNTLVWSIYNGKSPFEQMGSLIYSEETFQYGYLGASTPFIFICASSGTGKTQLPFCLDIPLIYLLFNEEMVAKSQNSAVDLKSQVIYRNFLPHSKCFLECLERDFQLITRLTEESGIPKNSLNFSMPDENTRLFTLDFILKLFFLTRERRSPGEKQSWIYSQLEIDEFVMTGETISNGRRLLAKLKEHQMPVVFFDECIQLGRSVEGIRKYTFVRRLIRRVGLIGVFMGTNSSISNYVSSVEQFESRSDDDQPWSYIVFKLAPVLSSYISERRQKLVRDISERANTLKADYEPILRFIDQISRTISQERPLFCRYLFDALESAAYLNNVLSGNRSFCPREYFEFCLDTVFTRFNERKRDFNSFSIEACDVFSFSNLQLLAPEYWRENAGYIEGLEKNAGIHNHIAFLHVDHRVRPSLGPKCTFFGLVVGRNRALNYLGVYEQQKSFVKIQFVSEQIFKPFLHEPIGQLMYVGQEGLKRLFIRNVRGEDSNPMIRRIPVRTYMESWKVNPLINTRESTVASNWPLFEAGIAMAALVATFYGSFNGTTFQVWLSHFVYELSSKPRPHCSIPFDTIIEKYGSIVIPFCAPSLKAQWNGEFAKYFTVSCAANIGVMDSSLGMESRDFKIIRCSDSRAILSGECKNYTNGVTNSNLIEIIERLTKFDSPLNLIVCSKLSVQAKSIQSSIAKAEHSDAFSLYHLDGQDNYTLSPIFIGAQSQRLFLIIEMANM